MSIIGISKVISLLYNKIDNILRVLTHSFRLVYIAH